MSDRPTPLTDALLNAAPSTLDTPGDARRMRDMVDHARRLERQRDAAVEALKAYERAGVGNSTDFRLQIKAWAISNAVLREIEGKS